MALGDHLQSTLCHNAAKFHFCVQWIWCDHCFWFVVGKIRLFLIMDTATVFVITIAVLTIAITLLSIYTAVGPGSENLDDPLDHSHEPNGHSHSHYHSHSHHHHSSQDVSHPSGWWCFAVCLALALRSISERRIDGYVYHTINGSSTNFNINGSTSFNYSRPERDVNSHVYITTWNIGDIWKVATSTRIQKRPPGI